jgi:formate hydrogenlyase transcriptional activator
LAYREISELKDKLAQEKVYLEEEFRSEMGFEQIIGNSSALKHVLQLVETVGPAIPRSCCSVKLVRERS